MLTDERRIMEGMEGFVIEAYPSGRETPSTCVSVNSEHPSLSDSKVGTFVLITMVAFVF
jgi:hypothetical protein